jgi:hypothetical protein
MPLEAVPILIVFALSGWVVAGIALIGVIRLRRDRDELDDLLHPFDHDGDGKSGGSKPQAPRGDG